VILALLLLSAPADACRIRWPLSRVTLPGEGSADMPVDGRPRVFLRGTDAHRLVGLLPSEYRLHEAGPDGRVGARVPTEARVLGASLELRPVQPLQPLTEHVLMRVHTYANGLRLHDNPRLDLLFTGALLGRTLAAWAWPEQRFRTAAGPEDRQPPPPRLSSGELRLADGSSCLGAGESLILRVPTEPEWLPTDVLTYQVEGLEPEWRAAQPVDPARATHWVESDDLGGAHHPVHLELREGGLRVRPVLHTISGQTIPAAAWTWMTATLDEDSRSSTVPPHPPSEPRHPFQEGIEVLASLPVEEGEPQGVAGPPACPHGLSTVAERVLPTADEGRWTELVGHGPSPWIRRELRARGHDALYAPFRSPTVKAIRVASDATVRAIDGGLVVVSPPGDGRIEVRAWTDQGQEAWRHEVPVPLDSELDRVDLSGDTLVLLWKGRAAPRPWQISLVDTRTGERGPQLDRLPLDPPPRQRPAVQVVDDGVLLAWTDGGTSPTYISLRSFTGATVHQTTVEGRGDPPELLDGPAGPILARDGLLTALDAQGRPEGAPSAFSAGSHSTTIRASVRLDGQLVLRWEDPNGPTWATLVDAEGRVAPPGRIGEVDIGQSSEALAWFLDEGTTLRGLGCRTTPQPDAPVRLSAIGR